MSNQPKKSFVRRAAVGTARAWAWSLGLNSLSQALWRIGGHVGSGAGYVVRKLKDSPKNYRHESFDEAVARLGLDEAHLVHQARLFSISSLSWLGAAVMVSCWLAWLSVSGGVTIQSMILCLGLMIMTGAKSITWRFRYCQLRDQDLYSFSPWFWSLGRRW